MTFLQPRQTNSIFLSVPSISSPNASDKENIDMTQIQTHNLQALSLKQTPVAIQPSPLLKNPSQGSRGSGGKGSSSDVPLDGSKKGESIVTEVCAINMSRSITALSGQPLSTPGMYQPNIH